MIFRFLFRTALSVVTLALLLSYFAFQSPRFLFWTPRAINNTIPDPRHESFDYIIIGAGSSGATLASRLSASQDVSVLLLEAGSQDNHLLIKAPLLFNKLFKTKHDWNFETTPQSVDANEKRAHFWPRGKVLGGSSSLNANIYMRGSLKDYDSWDEKLGGNSGWSGREVWDYFSKAKVQGQKPHSPHPLTTLLVQTASNHFKIPIGDAFTSGVLNDSVGYNQKTVVNGVRFSTAEAYLTRDVLARKNLHVKTNAHVRRVLFSDNTNEQDSRRVIGVEVDFKRGGKTHTVVVKANKEVILSAGSVQTPQLLMLSGVGDSQQLSKFGIQTVIDNAHVGQNLQDHFVLGIMQAVVEPISFHVLDESIPDALKHVFQWLITGEGHFSSNGAEVNGMWTSNIAKKNNETQPDFQFVAFPALYEEHGLKAHPGKHGFSFGAVLLRPKSKGFIALRSNNPHDHPIIDPQYFSDAENDDMSRLVDAMKEIRKMMKVEPLSKVVGEEIAPGSQYQTDADIARAIKKFGITLYHPIGTAAMGKVTDKNLKVIGTENLRVVDASIMPDLIGGNTNAPCIMIAEKAAEHILSEKRN